MKLTLLLFFVFTISFSFSQNKIKLKNTDEINISDLTKDIQIVKKNKDNFKMVWWIPVEYWKVVMNGSRIVNAGDVDMFVDVLDQYVLVASMNSELTAYGSFKPKPTNIQLKDVKGNIYNELKTSEISDEYLEVISTLKPSMTQTLGELGKQLKFHVFEKRGKNGKLITPMSEYGEFSVLLNQKTKFNFKLPLASIVEEKVCPEDEEMLNGN